MTPDEHLERAESLTRTISELTIRDPLHKGLAMSLRLANIHASLAAAGFAKQTLIVLEKLKETENK